MAEGERTPWWLRAISAALLVAVVAGPATGLARYVVTVEQQNDELAAFLAEATQAAAAAGQGDAAVAAAAPHAKAVQIVRSGGTDAFGIARGAEVTLDEVRDPAARAPDAEAFARQLVDRSAELESLRTSAGPEGVPPERRLERLEVPGHRMVAVYAAIMDADGAYTGLVRLVLEAAEPRDPVPWWRLLLGILLAAVAVGLALRHLGWPDRALAGGLAAVACAGVVGEMGWLFALWTALIGGGLAAAFTPGVAAFLRGLREQPGTYAYIAPAILGMVLLVFVPFGMGIALAFFDSKGNPIGLANFVEILAPGETADVNFYWTLGMTIFWTVTNVVLHVSIGLALALVLNRPDLRFKGIYRVLLIVPWAVPNYITALIWKLMFNTQYGAVNAILAIGGVGRVDWLGDSVLTNYLANLTTNVWLGFPFMMVVSLGALQSIPKELYEAARIDGANRWQAFAHVTVPLLKPALVPAIILGTIWTFNMFNVIYLVSGGAPEGKTDILITQAYYAFGVLKRYGFAAAYALLIFVILYLYGSMTNRITRAAEGAYK